MDFQTRKIVMQKTIKSILLGLLFGVLLYSAIYFKASRGDAFMYVDQKIRSSVAIESKVGRIERVRLDFFGFYEEKNVGSDEWVTMSIKVIGTRTTMVLDVKLKKTNEIWSIDQVSSQGSLLALD